MTSEHAKIQRRSPKQARSRATRDAILEAASQILERDGAAGYNTNAVAERAGVSIGTLYQYFPDKTAILLAAAEREAATAEPRLAHRHRAMLRALAAFLESLIPGSAASHAEPLAQTAAPVAKARRRRRSVVIKLQWAPPEPWRLPLLIPIPARPRRPRR
jgi:AcrR family transcriptional regulator